MDDQYCPECDVGPEGPDLAGNQGHLFTCSQHPDASNRRWVVAVYELDRRYGGPEEGGWWYDCGERMRILKIFKSSERAWEYCARFNRTLAYRRKKYRAGPSISSVAYAGGHLAARAYINDAPQYYPEHRPYYE